MGGVDEAVLTTRDVKPAEAPAAAEQARPSAVSAPVPADGGLTERKEALRARIALVRPHIYGQKQTTS